MWHLRVPPFGLHRSSTRGSPPRPTDWVAEFPASVRPSSSPFSAAGRGSAESLSLRSLLIRLLILTSQIAGFTARP